MRVYLNERIIDEAEALISVFDHGFLYGDGVYETLRVYGGRVFLFDEHLARLGRSASRIGLALPKSGQAIKDAVLETLRANDLMDAYVRITVSRGPGPIGLDPALCPRPTFVVFAMPFKPYPEEYIAKGVRLISAKTRRNPIEALDPAVKSLNFLNNIQAKREAIEAQAFDALMLNVRDEVAECTISNIFFVKDRALHTPSVECGILEGLTRALVLDLARKLKLTVHEGRYPIGAVYAADEVFLSNTTMEVMPVGELDGRRFQPGPATMALAAEYSAFVGQYHG